MLEFLISKKTEFTEVPSRCMSRFVQSVDKQSSRQSDKHTSSGLMVHSHLGFSQLLREP